MTLHWDDISVTRFCALGYRTAEAASPSAPEKIIIVFLGSAGGALRVLSHRDWRDMVREEDVEYVGNLMEDFRERARLTPDALFRQVASLQVGPVVTCAVGSDSDLQTQLGLLDLCENMVEV